MCPVLYVVQVKILCDATLAYMYMYMVLIILITPVFSPAYLRHVGPASLQNIFFFDVEKERDQKL